MINLASSLSVWVRKSPTETGGADALKRVGNVLNDFPENKVAVAGSHRQRGDQGCVAEEVPVEQGTL